MELMQPMASDIWVSLYIIKNIFSSSGESLAFNRHRNTQYKQSLSWWFIDQTICLVIIRHVPM